VGWDGEGIWDLKLRLLIVGCGGRRGKYGYLSCVECACLLPGYLACESCVSFEPWIGVVEGANWFEASCWALVPADVRES
jgi:hypothetical protein